MLRRYQRAVQLSAPRIAAGPAGVALDGYWLEPDRYFFLAESFEPSLRRTVAVPTLADARTGSASPVLPLDALASLIGRHSNRAVSLESLTTAEFDMPDRDVLAVRAAGHDYLIDTRSQQVIQQKPCLDVPVLYSPNGLYACFVKGFDVWLKDHNTGAERALTTDGAAHYCYGRQSETALSAVSYRKRPDPVGLWSPDSQWFLTHRIDERDLPDLPLVQHVPPGGGRPLLHRYKYPMPGDPLPVATYVAIHVASGRVVTFEDCAVPVTAFSPFFFRRVWFSGARTAWTLRVDRYSRQADLIELDLGRGSARVALSETAGSGYLDLQPLIFSTPNVRTLSQSDEIIWFSERDGWAQLYLHDASSGKLKNRITHGDWQVRDIVHVDEKERRLLFLAAGIDSNVDPARRALCSVNLDGSGFEIVLDHDGDIWVPATAPCALGQERPFRPANAQSGISPDGRWAIVRYANVARGNTTQLVDLDTRRGFTIAAASPAPDDTPPRHFTALAADGITRLHGVMFVPPDFDESRRYALIDYIYPGPQIAHQPQSFRALHAAPALALAELGFITIMFDTRGMPIGSRCFHQAGYGAFLEPPLADHAAVVRQLCARHAFIDGDRVGMIGASGGGFATARALCDYGETFKVGVAVCGNHDPTFYTAMWSDKYRGPGTAAVWASQANAAVAHKLVGKLLLISGDMDENVHLSHTLALADALIRANRDFDLLIVPNAGHDLLMTNGYAQRRAWDYLVRNLLGETPPANFEIVFEQHELTRLASGALREVRQ